MLSLCIPVYRYKVLPLVRELLRQVMEGNEDIEILVYDDASPNDEDWERGALRATPGIRYIELESNLGRAAIRNRMVRDALGSYCIMLDADAELPPDYLRKYQDFVASSGSEDPATDRNRQLVVVGGRKYAEQCPEDPDLQLHWWYGRNRESDVSVVNDRGWLGFHSNNFMATRALLLAHPFPEAVEGYGHEDTLWGQQFIDTGIRLQRIDNAVIHLGLEPHGVFLRKQYQAIRNLHRLKSETPHLRTRLIDLVGKSFGLTALARLLPENRLKRCLISKAQPNLIALDLLKLRWWHQL